MMNDADLGKAAKLAALIEALATKFADDPDLGRAQGFVPQYQSAPSRTIKSRETQFRSERTAWLYGVARRVLGNKWEWQVAPGLVVDEASLVIIGAPADQSPARQKCATLASASGLPNHLSVTNLLRIHRRPISRSAVPASNRLGAAGSRRRS